MWYITIINVCLLPGRPTPAEDIPDNNQSQMADNTNNDGYEVPFSDLNDRPTGRFLMIPISNTESGDHAVDNPGITEENIYEDIEETLMDP